MLESIEAEKSSVPETSQKRTTERTTAHTGTSQAVETETQNSNLQIVIDILHEERIEKAKDGTVLVRSSVEYPQIEGPDYNVKEPAVPGDTYYEEMCEEARNNYAEYPDNYNGSVFTRCISVARADSRLISFSYMDFQGNSMNFSSVNVDPTNGKILELKDLVEDEDQFREFCTQEILEQAAAINREEEKFSEDYENDIPGLIREGNLMFNEDGLVITAQEYELVSYAYGTTDFLIPYEKLAGMLKEERMPDEKEKTTVIVHRPGVAIGADRFYEGRVEWMLASFLDWTGFQWHYYPEDLETDLMSDQNLLGMVGAALKDCGSNAMYYADYMNSDVPELNSIVEWNSDYEMVFTKELVDACCREYFGKTIDPSVLEGEEGQYYSDGENFIARLSDWGESYPLFIVSDWGDSSELIQNKTHITVDYYMSSNLENKEVSIQYEFTLMNAPEDGTEPRWIISGIKKLQ